MKFILLNYILIMINGLNIPSYNIKIVGDGLQLTGSTVKKGFGCNIKCDKKRNVKKQTAGGLKILK